MSRKHTVVLQSTAATGSVSARLMSAIFSHHVYGVIQLNVIGHVFQSQNEARFSLCTSFDLATLSMASKHPDIRSFCGSSQSQSSDVVLGTSADDSVPDPKRSKHQQLGFNSEWSADFHGLLTAGQTMVCCARSIVDDRRKLRWAMLLGLISHA